jgi:hypothetical protein
MFILNIETLIYIQQRRVSNFSVTHVEVIGDIGSFPWLVYYLFMENVAYVDYVKLSTVSSHKLYFTNNRRVEG